MQTCHAGLMRGSTRPTLFGAGVTPSPKNGALERLEEVTFCDAFGVCVSCPCALFCGLSGIPTAYSASTPGAE